MTRTPTAADDAGATATEEPAATTVGGRGAGQNNGLDVLGHATARTATCPRTPGSRSSPACVQTLRMGEVAAEDQLPSLLITERARDGRRRRDVHRSR